MRAKRWLSEVINLKEVRLTLSVPLLCLISVLSLSGCVTSEIVTPSLVTLRVSVVSTGISASYRFAEEFRMFEHEYNAVMQEGGGSDSCPYIQYLIPERNVEEFIAWVELCAENVQREWIRSGERCRLYRVYFGLVGDDGVLTPLQCWDSGRRPIDLYE